MTEQTTRKDLLKLTPEGRAELAEYNRRFYQAQIQEPRERLARSDIRPTDYDLFPEDWLMEIGVIDEDFDWDENYKE